MPSHHTSSGVSTSRRAAEVAVEPIDASHLLITVSGDWLLETTRPRAEELLAEIARTSDLKQLRYDSESLGVWDTGLVTFVVEVERLARARGWAVDASGLPEGARRLVELAFAVPERSGARRDVQRENFLSLIGSKSRRAFRAVSNGIHFVGEFTLSFARLLRGKATYERSDFFVTVQEVSVEALGIVSMVGFLVGVILSFIGAVQFEKFGAGIYTANLVGLGIVRELGPIMAGVIMAGRTGASFAAYIGTMRVNEEIDALRTLGIDPIDYLVLPRALALMLMMPLITLYADLMGIIGGTMVSIALLDVSPILFLEQLRAAIGLGDVLGGLFMASVFGVLVALSGCQRGIECGTSAQAVGEATTSAVVTGIVAIVASCSVLNFIYTMLGI